MSKSKIIITGANGQLGKELQGIAKFNPEFEFIFLSKEDLPIHQSDIVQKIFAAHKPQFCINCAAYTAVDRAETEKDHAFLINGKSTGILAEACNIFQVKLIHISTDYVFDGSSVQPYKEDDKVNPVNTYGASKLKGEELAIDKNEQSIIIRTSWVYSEFGNNFVKTMIRLMKEKENLGIVNDQWGSPTYAADLAKAIIDIIKSNIWKPGIYHYSNEGIISWYEFAKSINELISSNCKIYSISTAEFPTAAKRPEYSGFNKEKIRVDFKLIIPDWKTSLQVCLQKLIN